MRTNFLKNQPTGITLMPKRLYLPINILGVGNLIMFIGVLILVLLGSCFGDDERALKEKARKDSIAFVLHEKAIADSIAEYEKSSYDSILNDTSVNKEDDSQIYTVVEEMPTYPGGDDARIKFLSSNIIYPQLAKEKGIQGTVFVTFVIDEKGFVSDVKVLRGIGGGCDQEAVRVVKMMPRWVPGRMNGKTVRVQFNMPIKFLLD